MISRLSFLFCFVAARHASRRVACRRSAAPKRRTRRVSRRSSSRDDASGRRTGLGGACAECAKWPPSRAISLDDGLGWCLCLWLEIVMRPWCPCSPAPSPPVALARPPGPVTDSLASSLSFSLLLFHGTTCFFSSPSRLCSLAQRRKARPRSFRKPVRSFNPGYLTSESPPVLVRSFTTINDRFLHSARRSQSVNNQFRSASTRPDPTSVTLYTELIRSLEEARSRQVSKTRHSSSRYDTVARSRRFVCGSYRDKTGHSSPRRDHRRRKIVQTRGTQLPERTVRTWCKPAYPLVTTASTRPARQPSTVLYP